MKKSVLALLVLLAVLIVTCVYQKTYTLYETSPKELTLVERKTTVQSLSTAKPVAAEKKEEKTSTLPIVSVPTSTQPVEVKSEPETQSVEVKPESETQPVEVKLEPETKSVSEHKPAAQADEIVEEKPTVTSKSMEELIPFYNEMVKKEAKEKDASSAKTSTSEQKVPTVITKEMTSPQSSVAEKSKVEDVLKTESLPQNDGEKEIVDYIMWALKNRDIALKNRDEIEARIHELIAEALKDRQVVLDERSKNGIALDKEQKELIDARDASYESVINPKTTNQGEK